MTSLKQLPLTGEVDFYFFLIKIGNMEDEFTREFEKNYKVIAKEIGERNILIEPLSEFWGDQIPYKYLGQHANQLIRNDLYPGLLITDKHPNDIEEDDDTLRIYIPLNLVYRKFSSYTILVQAIFDFIKSKNENFFERFTSQEGTRHIDFRMINEIIIAKPQIFGFGINMNKIIEKLFYM